MLGGVDLDISRPHLRSTEDRQAVAGKWPSNGPH